MKTTLVPIGNSRGIRIPKPLLKESGLKDNVELQVKKGEIKIVPARAVNIRPTNAILSEKTLAEDWNRPEEDKAWAELR